MWTPPSPDAGKEEVEEEPCVAVDAVDRRAIPFFTHESGAIFIKGGTVVNDDNMEVSDVIMEDGKITQVGQDLEVPSGKLSKDFGKYISFSRNPTLQEPK